MNRRQWQSGIPLRGRTCLRQALLRPARSHCRDAWEHEARIKQMTGVA